MLGCLYSNVKPNGERRMIHTLSQDARAAAVRPHPQALVEAPTC